MAKYNRLKAVSNEFLEAFFGFRHRDTVVTPYNRGSSFSRVERGLIDSGVVSSTDFDRAFREIGGSTTLIDGRNKRNQINNFHAGDPNTYTVINKVATQAASIPMKLYEVVDESALKRYKAFKLNFDADKRRTNYAEYVKLKNMALREIENNDLEIAKVLEKPNKLQTQTKFRELGATHYLAMGENFISGTRATKNGAFVELVNMYPQQTDIIFGDHVNPIKGYRIEDGKYDIEIPAEDVIYRVRPNPLAIDELETLRGFSPLEPLSTVIQSSISAFTASKSMFDNNGVVGILSADPSASELGLAPNDVNMMNDAIKKSWGGSLNQGQVRAIAAAVKYQKTGLSPVDLGIEAAKVSNLRTISAAFDVPSVLVGDTSSSTYNNMQTAEKAFYTNAVMPYNTSLGEDLNSHFVPAWNKKLNTNLYIDFDYSGVEALAEDFHQQAQTYIDLVESGITSREYAARQLNVELGDEPENNMNTNDEQKYIRLSGNKFKGYPKEAIKAAEKALNEHKDDLLSPSVTRAESLVKGRSMSIRTIKATHSILSKTTTSKQVYLAYGGDTMKAWTDFILNKFN